MGSGADPDELPGRILSVRNHGTELSQGSEYGKHDYGAFKRWKTRKQHSAGS